MSIFASRVKVHYLLQARMMARQEYGVKMVSQLRPLHASALACLFVGSGYFIVILLMTLNFSNSYFWLVVVC
jgi:hypothetical protein